MMRNEKYTLRFIVFFFLIGCLIVPELHADGWPPTVSIISPDPGTSASPQIVSLSGTNTVRVLVQVWDDLAITANSVYVDYSTDKSAWTAVGPATLNTNYPNAANLGVYEIAVSGLSAGSGYYLRARAASADGTGYSSDRRTMVDANNDPRYVYIMVRASKSGTGTLLARDASGQLCMDCHNLQTHSSQSTDTSNQNWAIVCGECHTPHNTHNVMLVKEAIVTPNSGPKSVKFYNRTGDADNSFVDSSPPAGTPNGVCQVCHTRTMNSATLFSRWRTTGNDDTHYTTAVGTQACTSCHPHSVGFKGSCISCHGYPPVDNASLINGTATFGATGRQTQTAPGAGAHNKHYNVKGYACEACHTGGGATGNHNKLTTPALVHIGFNFLSGAYQSGTYTSPDFTNPDYDLAAGNGGTTVTISGTQRVCSNFYCHSKGQSTSSFTASNAAYSTAIWEGSMPADCAGCHGNDTASANLISSGSHTKHLNADNTCTNCHVATVSGNRAIGNESSHVNNLINIAFNSTVHSSGTYSGSASPMTKSPGSSYASCSNIRCHNDGKWIWFNDTSKKMGNTPVWGSAGGCSSCHGSTATYTNYRAAAPQYTSYPTDTTSKPNAHVYHVDVRDNSADGSTGTGTQCKHCHVTTTATNISTVVGGSHLNDSYSLAAGTQTYRKWTDGTGSSQTISMTYSFNATTGTSGCSNVSCHPETTATKWSNAYSCLDCHNIDMTNTTGYHHVMNTSQLSVRSYPTSTPATTSSSDTARTCVMCHADHDIFSTMLNASSSGRAYNLRTDITVTPTKSGGFTNTDFDNALTNGGICTSCHKTELSKNTASQKNDGTTKTVMVTKATFSSSNHNYTTSSTFTTPTSGSFNANCSKCHVGDNDSRTFQNTANKFKLHDDKAKRLLASLGATSGSGAYDYKEDYEEGFCYRCHSKAADAIGGTRKSADANDWYGAVTNMTAASTGIFGIIGPPPPTYTSATTLYLRNNTEITPSGSNYPSLPGQYYTISGTYAGNTTLRQRALTTGTGTNQETWTQATGANNSGRYYYVAQFVSPTIGATVSFASGSTFNVTIRNLESNAAANAYTRVQLYKWSGGIATPFRSAGAYQHTTEIPAAAGNQTIAFPSDTAITLNPGDSVLVEIEFVNGSNTSYNISHYWGNNTSNARIVFPSSVSWQDPTVATNYTHAVGSYTGIHKPSPTDETQAYMSANRHVECADCHNVHAATAANPLNSVSGVDPTNGTAGNVPTAYTAVTVTDPDLQYKVCFKCHSDWAGFGTGTNQAIEFNTNNDSFHWVEKDKYTYTVNTGTGKGIWQNAQFNQNAVPTQGTRTYVQVMMPGRASYTDASLRTTSLRCSDCHGAGNADGGVSIPEGPHGSTYANILKVPAGSPYTTWNATVSYSANSGTIWCFNCHHATFTGTGMSTPNNQHTSNHNGFPCQDCHLANPHGQTAVGTANQRKHLLKPSVFTEGVDSEQSGNWNQHGSWVIPGCT